MLQQPHKGAPKNSCSDNLDKIVESVGKSELNLR